MEKKDFSNLGQEIKDIVQDAINTRDFNRLNTEIADTVNSALSELRRSLGFDQKTRTWREEESSGMAPNEKSGQAAGETKDRRERRRERDTAEGPSRPPQRKNRRNPSGNAGWKVVQNASGRYVWVKADGNKEERSGDGERSDGELGKAPAIVEAKPVGRIGGILFTVFGSVTMSGGLLTLLVFFCICLLSGSRGGLFAIGLAVGVPLAAAGAGMLLCGRMKAGRVARFRSYLNQMAGREYCQLEELASQTGRSVKYIVKDLRSMIRRGMFPQGHIDDFQTCFILNRKTWQLYQDMMEAKKEEKIGELQNEAEDTAGRQVQSAIGEGRRYLLQIREANDAIPGEEISAKLTTLEMVTGKIFAFIERHPHKAPDIHKFMNYYLPTTLKLVNTYKELDSQPVQGKNISTAKREIESTMDTINEAFARLLDSMFEDAALDVSTDISVLQTMFAQEGLTGQGFGQCAEGPEQGAGR